MDYKKIVVQWLEFPIPQVNPRETKLDPDVDFIWTVIGARRTGKTFFCFQIIHDLLTRGVPKENILYLNFEDEKLLGANASDLAKLIDAYLELSPPDKNFKCYFFLDEIQNVEQWDTWARRMHDTEKSVRLVPWPGNSQSCVSQISKSV